MLRRVASSCSQLRLLGHGRRCLHNERPVWLQVSEEVSDALATNKPVVALESTIITHGMPEPTNITTAQQVENIVREQGAVPATIAVVNGMACVGLNTRQLTNLANSSNSAVKVSRRDLPFLLVNQNSLGGATVSATTFLANLTGIRFIATGGVGGVHRGGETSLDVSADLTELGRTPVCVVSAGIKSLLDIPRSLEYLETQGVCVVGFGTEEFPSFFTRSSGSFCPSSVNSVKQAAKLVRIIADCNSAGMMLAVPIPVAMEAMGQQVEEAIVFSLKEVEEKNIRGARVTPYILQRVNELTRGSSLMANIALMKNNATIASQIAVEYANHSTSSLLTSNTGDFMIVIGGSSIDHLCHIKQPPVESVEQLVPASYVGQIGQAGGGVGRNVAQVLSSLGSSTRFFTAIGDDDGGRFIKSSAPQIHWQYAKIVSRSSGLATASYMCMLNSTGNLLFGLGSMDIHGAVDSDYVREGIATDSHRCRLVILDGNPETEAISQALQVTAQNGIPVWYEPTDVLKATKILDALEMTSGKVGVHFISPNLPEFEAIYTRITGKVLKLPDNPKDDLDAAYLAVLYDAILELKSYVPHWLVKLGRHGLLSYNPQSCVWYSSPAARLEAIVNASGAGDSLVAVIVHLHIGQGLDMHTACLGGLRAAEMSMKTNQAVSEFLRPDLFTAEAITVWAEGLNFRNIM